MTNDSIGIHIKRLHAIREEKRAIEKELKAVEERYKHLERHIMELLDKDEVTRAACKEASVGITESVHPSVEDWDKFYEYIHDNEAFYLLERRPASRACREMFELQTPIPGVVPFTKRKLTLTSL